MHVVAAAAAATPFLSSSSSHAMMKRKHNSTSFVYFFPVFARTIQGRNAVGGALANGDDDGWWAHSYIQYIHLARTHTICTTGS